MTTRLQIGLREEQEQEQEDIVYADAMREMLQRASIDVKLKILRHVMHDGSNSNEKMFLCLKLLGLMDDSVFAFEESVLGAIFDLAFYVRYGVCRLYLNFIRKSGHTGIFADFEMMDRICAGWRSVTLSGHTELVCSACFSPDGTKIVTASWDNTAKVWDIASGECEHTLEGHTNYVMSACFSPDGSKIVTASDDETAKIWYVKRYQMK